MKNDPVFLPGSLKSVQMINFMKHSNLQIALKPCVNFITGRNGSGKSSILVAISVGLGSNIRITGRGTSLSSLIKDGQSEAQVIVILNNGTEGYQYERYGNEIKITRKIHKSSSSFEIQGFPKNSASSIKEELNRILSYFNIQIDNPCSIMQQDTAREFVGASSSQRKYELFMRGTLISHLTREIETITQHITTVENQKMRHIEEKAELDKEYEEQQRQYETITETSNIQKKISDMKDEMVWAYYRADINESITLHNKLDRLNEQLYEQESLLNEKNQIFKAAESEYQVYQESSAHINQKISEIKRNLEELSKKLGSVKAELGVQKATKDRRVNTISSYQEQIKKMEEKLRRESLEKERLAASVQNQRAKFEEERRYKIDELEERKRVLVIESEKLSTDLQSLTNEDMSIKEQISQVQQRLSHISTKLRSFQTDYQDDKAQLSLRSRIEKNKDKFSFPPIGPLSQYIKLKDPKWGVAAQHIIGKSLDMFLVHSHEDEKMLRKVLQSDKSIAILRFDQGKHRIPNPSPPTQDAERIIDVINIVSERISGIVDHSSITVNSSDIVFNALVDIYNAERIWCIEDEKKARDVAFQGLVPVAITLHGVQYKKSSGYDVRLGAKTNNTSIGVDYRERIQQLIAQEEQAKDEMSYLGRKGDSVKSNLSKLKVKKQSNEKEKHSIMKEIEVLRGELLHPPDQSNELDNSIDVLKKKIEEKKKDLEKDSQSIPDLENRIDELTKNKGEIIEQIQVLRSEIEEIEKSRGQSDSLLKTLSMAKHEYEHQKRVVDELNNKKSQLSTEYRQSTEKAETTLSKVRKTHADTEGRYRDTARDTQTLSTLLETEKKKLEIAKKSHGLDINEVLRKYEQTKKSAEKAKRYLIELEDFIESAKNALQQRKNKFEEILNSITRRTKISFSHYLKSRQYNGRLKFEHNNQLIDIGIRLSADQEYTDVTNLSGGEKSFCLVSLLLSLWDVMDCPFFCIDEFDVFMDDVNRITSTKLLVDSAQAMSTKQFIFITPLSLDHITQNSQVTVFEVKS